MAAVAACAAFFALARGTGWLVGVLLIPTGIALSLALAHGLPARDKAHRAQTRFFLLALVMNAVVFFQGLCEFGPIALILMLQTSLLVVGLVCVSYAFWLTSARDRRDRGAAAWARLVAVALASLLPFVMIFMFLPQRAAVLISRPALNRLADDVAAGKTVQWPRRVGLLRVTGGVVEPVSGNVGLVLDPNPSGRTGLARIAPGMAGVPGPFLNLNIDRDMGGGWRFQQED